MTIETAPAVRSTEEHRILTLRRELEARADEFRMVLPSHITPEKLQRTILTAVQANPELLACDRRSFLTAAMKCAQDGLLPDGREAAIVPFKKRTKDAQRGWLEIRVAQYMPMVYGLRKKCLQSLEIKDIFAAVVYRQEIERAGCFHYEEGTERTLRHRPILDPDFAPTDADIALAYSVATFADGFKSFEVMRRGEIDRVREASQTGAQYDAKGNPRDPKGPWVEWFPEMAKKTVLRRHTKSLPQSGDIILTDVEADDMGLSAARSAVALLGSQKPDAPRSLGGPGETIDPETGEIIDKRTFADLETDEAPEMVQPPSATPEIVAEGFDPATEALRAKVEGEAELSPDLGPPRYPDPTADPEPLTEAPQPAPVGPPEFPEVDDPEPPENKPETDAETDEYGIAKSDEETRAQGFIDRARRCELLIDLKSLEREAELDLAAMAPELSACVDVEFANARKRLTPKGKG
jgi:recombination protein RecT